MSRELEIGDRVVPTKVALNMWKNSLTKGKIYTVVIQPTFECAAVYDDGGEGYWSSPHKYFTKVYDKPIAGGTLL